ncbi:hypothetical protein [Vibrio splendidus]|uniref:hypothetical protein n=1 Tax=Vibrio splendidus TaxID=29497 RepID=UPI00030F6F1E|nr:hypothetical protein [Vibrio splendidus]OEE54090.1 hypothetical protein A146_13395 [Vibrio splendidus FF-500]
MAAAIAAAARALLKKLLRDIAKKKEKDAAKKQAKNSKNKAKSQGCVTNNAVAGKITGYTKHGLNQALGRNGGRGVNAKHMLDAVKNPKKVVEAANGTTKYQGKKATVVLNGDGKVVTTFGKSRGPQIWKEGTTRATGSGSAQRRANEQGFSYNPRAIR